MAKDAIKKSETKDETKKSKNYGKSSKRRSNSKNAKGKSSTREAKTGNEGSANSAAASFKSEAISNILNASANIAIRNVAGNPIVLDTSLNPRKGNLALTNNSFTIPGVIGVMWAPMIGKATGSQTDPINLAARNMWMNLRSMYSNRIPYTAGAIVQYVLALDGVITAYHFLKRAYGVVFAYDARNRYVPDALLRAMGINPIDFRANLPEIKVFLNKVATQLSAFGVPTDIRLVLDHIDLTSHIYMDGTTANAQYIIPSPQFVWKMDWVNNKLNKFELVSVQAQDGTSWNTIKQNFTNLVESFVNYEDVYQIASDMLRLYGSLATVQPVDADFAIGPEYSEEFLSMFHNATLPFSVEGTTTPEEPYELTEVQAPDNVGAISATYSTGFRIDKAAHHNYYAHACTPGLLDFHVTDPTMDDVVAASRWKYVLGVKDLDTTTPRAYVIACGTSILTEIFSVSMEDDANHPGQRVYKLTVHTHTGPTLDSKGTSVMMRLREYPLMVHAEASYSASSKLLTIAFDGVEGCLDQYHVLHVDELERIHEAVILDKFDAAGIGTLNLHKAK